MPAARGVVAAAALEQVENLDDESFGFLWTNVRALDVAAVAGKAAGLGRAAWQRDPGLLVHMVKEGGVGRQIVERTLQEVGASELVDGLVRAPELRSRALAVRPDVVGEVAFWLRLDEVDEAFAAARDWGRLAAARALIRSRREELATRAVKELGAGIVLEALRAAWDVAGDGRDVWLGACAADAGAVRDFLRGNLSVPGPLLYGLARLLRPDAVPNEGERTPGWRRTGGRSGGCMVPRCDTLTRTC